jgi:hypothetical protein
MSRSKHFSLGQHLAAGQIPMFMTGKEIQTHLDPWHGDREGRATNEPDPEEWGGKKIRPETNSELWERKYDESTTPHENEDGVTGAEHNPKYDNLAHDIANEGFKAPRIPVNFDAKEVLGGHHRVAVGAKEHPNHLFPVIHYDNIHEARHQLKDHY